MLTLRFRRTLVIPCTILVFATATTFTSADSRLDAEAIGQAAGAEATATEDGVVRVGWSRDDVPVTVDGLRFPVAAGLGSWAAFKTLPDGPAMVMGDTVVFEDEITPAMDAAFANGLEITALHNHFVLDRPPAYFMHVGGHAADIHIVALHNHMVGETPAYYFLHYWCNGNPESLARGIRRALDAQE